MVLSQVASHSEVRALGQHSSIPNPGQEGYRGLLTLALPLIAGNTFAMAQVAADRAFLARYGPDTVGAATAAFALFMTPLTFLQQTVLFATTFVAQYVGAGRPERVGPVTWQAIYIATAGGVLLLALTPLAPALVALAGHAPGLQSLETIYFRCLCVASVPLLLMLAVAAFFAGRGKAHIILFMVIPGAIVHLGLDYLLIFGHGGFPEWGIAGAGWATVAGSWVSALVGLVLLFRGEYRREYRTLAGWRLDRPLIQRLLKFGVPHGVQWSLEGLGFSIFILLIGSLGSAQLTASSIVITCYMLTVQPAAGMGQAVGILVGQKQGMARSDLAEAVTWRGLHLAAVYMAVIAGLFLSLPDTVTHLFHTDQGNTAGVVGPMVVGLLRFAALFGLLDAANLVLAFALRGAGDTRFVAIASLALSALLMILPAWVISRTGGGLYLIWSFAVFYVGSVVLALAIRFRQGSWRALQVIESVMVEGEGVAELTKEEAVAEPSVDGAPG
jgi:MATE family, multidrug efflux pump